MDELLQRMLDVDREGDKAVKEAEAQAAALREAASQEAAKIMADSASQCTAQCQKLIADVTAECEAKRAQALAQAEVELKARGERYTELLESYRDKLFADMLK